MHCLPSWSDESEDDDEQEDEEETAFFFVFLELALVPDSAVRDWPGWARETEALAALAEDRGRPSSSSDSLKEEEEEDEEGGAATRLFLVDVFTGVEVSGPRAGLLPRLEGGAGPVDCAAPGSRLGAVWPSAVWLLLPGTGKTSCSVSGPAGAGSQLGLFFLLVDSLPNADARHQPVFLGHAVLVMRLGVGSSLNFWFAGVRRALSANSCGFLIRVRGTSRCTQVMNRAPAALRPSLRRSSRSGSPVMVFIRATTSSRVAGSLVLLSLVIKARELRAEWPEVHQNAVYKIRIQDAGGLRCQDRKVFP